MPLAPGSNLLHYRLVEKIGEGGMGVVWRAIDMTLEREVAIKVLPEDLAEGGEALARFEREARLLASLNHSNIATVHGFHEAGGDRFLAMELVGGEDLAQLLQRGRLSVEELVPIALQIARALEAAHETGIIHRDLKPANVRLAEDGTVKVLDFGLAKALEATDPGSDPTLSPTLTSMATMEGRILGTAAYMSPEQAAGQAVDKRCDIWSFGVLLWELLSGQRIFHGETVSHTLADVLRKELDWEELPESVPASLRRLLGRCLERDAARRLRDIGEARVVLEDLAAGRESEVESIAGPSRGAIVEAETQRLPWLLAGIAGLVAVFALALLLARDAPPEPQVLKATLSSPLTGATRTGDGRLIAISPDGRVIANGGASAGDDILYLRPLDSFETSDVSTAAARLPFFSPDGSMIGFIVNRDVYKRAVKGGAPIRLGSTQSFPTSATWASDGNIYFIGGGRLLKLPAAGGESTPVDASGEAPDAYISVERLAAEDALLLSIRDDGGQPLLHVFDLETRALTGLGLEGADARYLDSGHLIFAAKQQVMAVGFDLGAMKTMGAPVPVLERAAVEGNLMQLSVSDNGTVAYLPVSRGLDSQLVRVDRSGATQPLLTVDLPYSYPNDPRFSPDGTKLVNTSALGPIWVLDLASQTPTRLSEQGFYPLWSPDGSTIYYGTTRGESYDLYKRRVDMSAPEEKILDQEYNLRSGDMAPDGSLVYRLEVPGKGMDIMLWRNPDDPSSIVPLLDSPANELSPAVSSDGRWIAFVSDDSGRDEIFVTSFPEPSGFVQVSDNGGTSPAWSPDTRELFYFEKDRFVAARVETEPTFRVLGRETLFSGSFTQYRWQRQYDVHPDGTSFVMIESPANSDAEIITNWFVELERLVPSGR